MTDDRSASNVIRLDSKRSMPKKDVFLSLASQLITDHATTNAEGNEQRIVGDRNFQFSPDPVVRQSIEGNWNIQISTMGHDMEGRLAVLESILKSQLRP